mmetsp:Transcript_15737/g.44037  ORF Transcript_15737/g.44037 Transcript_15737/m.44037 type:complete len:379 (-) Transcript_15737:1-1137(-)
MVLRRTPKRTARGTHGSPSPPSPVCLERTSLEGSELEPLDKEFERLKEVIIKRQPLYTRVLQVRIRQWLEKLSEVTTNNKTWRKNRNKYALLMLEQLRRGRLEEPFDKGPPGGPLPTLPKYLTYSFMADSGVARSPSPVSWKHADDSSGEMAEEQIPRRPPLSPSQPLDGRLAQGSAIAVMEGHAQSTQEAAEREPLPQWPGRAATDASPLLPERDPEVQREALLRMEWQLGASRERQLDLEQQLAEAQEMIHRQAHELLQLRSELEAKQSSGTAPQRESHCERRKARDRLDQVISRVQAARSSWEAASPEPSSQEMGEEGSSWDWRWQHGGSRQHQPRREEGLPPFREDEDFLRHLEEFQLRTDALQSQINRMQTRH